MLSLTLHLITAGLLAAPPAEPAPSPATEPAAPTAAPAPSNDGPTTAPASEARPDAAALSPAERPAESAPTGASATAPAEPGPGPGPGPSPGSLPSLTGPGDQTVAGSAGQGGPPVSPVAPAAPAPAGDSAPTVAKEAKKKEYPLIPIRWRAEVGVGGGTATFFDPATKAVSDRGRYSRFDITARGDMRLGDGRLFLGGVAGYRGFTTDTGDIYDVADLELELREPYFALRLAIMAIEGVDVFVEAGGGPSLYRTEFKTSEKHFDDTVSGYAMGQAGVLLYLPKKWLIRKGSSRVTVGLELGVGGAYRPDLRLTPARETPDDPIDTGNLQLGSVNLSGVTWRAGLFVRFM